MNSAFIRVLLGSLAWTAFAQPQSVEPNSVPKVQLTLRCPVSPCRFRQGEVILLDLVFTAHADGYGVLARYLDRFKGGGLDQFIVQPNVGTGDPFAGSRIVVAGSFNPAPTRLRKSAQIVLSLELNQWVRFDKTGKYQVTALSHRAGQNRYPTLALKSDPIEIEVVPADPKWQLEQLTKIRRVLPTTPVIKTEAHRAAVRALAYLATDDALCEIRRLLPDGGWPYPEKFVNRNRRHLLDWELARLESLRHPVLQ